MSKVQVLVLGTAEFYRDGQRARIRSAKSAALLAYLAVTHIPQTRDHLADLLWPDSMPEASRKNLRNMLWAIRKGLGPEVFSEQDPDRLGLADEIWSDVAAFEAADAAAMGADTQEMVALYRGPLLDGLAFADAPDLEIWLATQRQRYEQMYLRLLQRSVAAYRAAGDWAAVIQGATQALVVDPLQEPVYRLLMEAHARLGNRGEALRLYDRLREALALELDVEPLPETESLRQAIVEGSLQPVQAADEQPSPRPKQRTPGALPPSSPFVGRKAEMAALDEELQRAASGQARVAVLSGELGIGKSRLWEEWSAAQRNGSVVLATRCLDTTQSLPFAPLIRLLHQQVCLDCLLRTGSPISPIWLAELSRVMPEIQQRWPDLSAPPRLPHEEERRRLFEAFVQVFRALNGQPLLLFVDDAHWIDRATLDWLLYLVDRMADDPLLLVLAVRTGEEASHLEQVLAGWHRKGILRLLELEGLTLGEAAELVEALGMDSVLAKSLQERSGGNPYFLLELRHAPEGGVPPELAQLVRYRLDRLPEAARQVLQAAAILDSGFEFRTLRRTSGRGVEETLDGLDVLLDSAVLVEREGHYDFVHPLVAMIVRGDLGIARRSFLHRRAAEVLEATHAGHLESVAGRLADHYAGAGRTGKAAHYAEQAGHVALSLTAVEEAVAFYRQALALEPTPTRRIGMGRALYLRGDLEEGRNELSRALAGFRASEDRKGAARACLLLAESYLPSGQGKETIHWAERALAQLEGTDDAEAVANAHYLLGAGGLQSGGSLAEAEEQLAEAIRLAGEHDLVEMSARAYFELGNLLAQRGQLPQAVESFGKALVLDRKAGLRFEEVLSHNNLAFHVHLLGDLATAKEHAQTGLDLAARFSLLLPRQYLYSTSGEIALAGGELDEAEEWFERALDEAERHGNRPQAANIRANLGLVAQARGEFDRALELLDTAYDASRAGSDKHLQIKIELWLAELRLARGERTAAKEMLDRAAVNLAGGEREGLLEWANRVRKVGGFPPAGE